MQNTIDEKKIVAGMLMLGGMVFSIVVVYFVISSQGNVLGNAYKLFLPAAFAVGLMAPRVGLNVLVICAGYIDLLKRFMVFDLQMQYTDLYFILGIPPIICLGVAMSIVMSYLLRWRVMTKEDGKLILISAGVCLYFGSFLVVGGAGIQPIVNTCVYPTLLFSIPILIRTREELLKHFRFIIIVFIPVALWGLKQSFFGLSDFEMRYTLSGMTTQTDILWDTLRPFSTMAAEGQLSLAMSVCAVLVLCFIAAEFCKPNPSGFLILICLALFVLFVFAGLLSLKRIPVIVWFLSIVGFYAFKTKARTGIFYAFMAVFFITMVFFGREVVSGVASFGRMLNPAESMDYLFGTSTFNSRLRAFEVLRTPSSYTLTGLPEHERTGAQQHVHIWFAAWLLDHGILPFPVLLAVGAYMLYYIHAFGWRAPPGLWKSTYCLLSACFISFIALYGLGNYSAASFPGNYFNYLVLAGALTLIFKDSWQKDAAKKEPVSQPASRDLDRPVAV